MKLSHIVIASTAALSFGAWAEGNKAGQDRQWQSGASTTMQYESHASSSVIKQAQQKLSAAGHDAGQADGIMGPKTAQALKDFQQAKGLEASGRLDQRTLAELGLDSSSVGASSSISGQGSVGASSSGGGSSAHAGPASASAGVDTPSASNESEPANEQRR
jgi:peptidoglycan hydrolase-like protein with peptidoglycan-binding domain